MSIVTSHRYTTEKDVTQSTSVMSSTSLVRSSALYGSANCQPTDISSNSKLVGDALRHLNPPVVVSELALRLLAIGSGATDLATSADH